MGFRTHGGGHGFRHAPGSDPNFTFVLSAPPLLDGDRPAWHLPANPTADLGTIATLAKTLGVDGDVVAVEGGWQVGEQNGGHGLYVGNAAGLPWYFVNVARPLHMSRGYDGSPRCRCRHHAAAVRGTAAARRRPDEG